MLWVVWIDRQCSGMAGEHLGRATMILPSADDDRTVEEVHHRLRRTLGSPVLVVGERAVNHDWSRAFSLASRCGAVMRAIGHTDLGAMTGQYALYAMIFDTERVRELDRFIADSIGPLLAYDQRRGTDLVDTLSAYYAHRANIAATARALYVHVNTLRYRLEKVIRLTGMDPRRLRDAFVLRMAFTLARTDRPAAAAVEPATIDNALNS